MAIVHIVLFEFKPSLTAEQVNSACSRMMALREKCIHPTTQKPYIKSCVGGRNNSPEGQTGGLTHGFVIEFEKEEDREYYLTKDPEHLAFVEFAGTIMQSARVLDFEPGKF